MSRHESAGHRARKIEGLGYARGNRIFLKINSKSMPIDRYYPVIAPSYLQTNHMQNKVK
jgi:hypothetical protein